MAMVPVQFIYKLVSATALIWAWRTVVSARVIQANARHRLALGLDESEERKALCE